MLGDQLQGDRGHRAGQRLDEGAEQDRAVGAAGARVGGALGVGHQAQNVPPRSEHAGDPADRAVRVLAVAEREPVLVLEPRQIVGRADVAVVVRDRQLDLAQRVAGGEQRGAGRDLDLDRPADELEPGVADQGARQGPASARIWKPLQIPSTATPAAARRITSAITGARAAIAPQRR